MKILSNPAGDALLTNAEVMHWLRDQSKDNAAESDADSSSKIPLPPNARLISDDLAGYFNTCPSANQTTHSVRELFRKLKKYKLSDPELLMIANIRPEAYAHITPLIADIYNRFDYETIMEILKIVDTTLEPRPDNDGDAGNKNVLEEEEEGGEEQEAEAEINKHEPAAVLEDGGDEDDNDEDEGGVIVKKENEEAEDVMAD